MCPKPLQHIRHVRCLFQAFWTEHLWPSAVTYAELEQSGSYTPCAFLQDDATSRRERESCPVWICDQTGSSHNQLTGQAALFTPLLPPLPSVSYRRSSPAANGPNHSQLQCLHHCWPDQPGADRRELAGEKNNLSVSRMMAERNISLSNWPGTALWRVCVCAQAETCTCVFIFKQHLSSLYINVWSLYTDNVSSPQGSSLHSGHMDNQIPVVELVIKNTHGRWVTVRAADSFGQTGLQIAQRSTFSFRPQLVVRLMPGQAEVARWARIKKSQGQKLAPEKHFGLFIYLLVYIKTVTSVVSPLHLQAKWQNDFLLFIFMLSSLKLYSNFLPCCLQWMVVWNMTQTSPKPAHFFTKNCSAP